MDVLILVGRILFAAVFLGGAIGHFTTTEAMSAYTESMGLRPGRLFVIGSGLWQMAAALLILPSLALLYILDQKGELS